ncbi:hypothetical protein PAHAL_3G205400 [Panicum hallii]|jgi:hypothetical protein|uniref:Glycosyltransferase n=1 Tax=Panicum hallii TaxID=206008 RepID=A0A2S3HAL3_9POAL|nr:anthocyanidin 5,3-O-glucosyltransferase-like [Panicum hallii]PAN18493.1 hypothetical protein PAHAL_3G205400 [Panicum hallii]
MKKTVILYPGLSVSHFVPMVELADALLAEGYAVVVAYIDPTLKEDIALPAVVDRLAACKPSVAFHRLPRIQDAPAFAHGVSFLASYLDFVGRFHEHLRNFLLSMPPGSVHALVVDMMSVGVLGATCELGIPGYTFFPSNASALATAVQVSSIRAEGRPGLWELGDAPLDFRGVPPVPASHLTAEVLEDPGSEVYRAVANMFARIRESQGILANTFGSLEPRAVGALCDPRFSPKMPPLYCVGPLVAGSGEAKEEEKHECLAWLDEQPERSVVFLCFGGTGAGNHSVEQLKEMAIGLENSGHRFLWVVRAPPSGDDPEKPFDPRADPDLDALLPEGFLERTRGGGLVAKLWVPQVEVLRHAATGAFVTHCGWNSVLEGITAGVPMLCWPLYAEQKMNKTFMVEEYGVGVEVLGWQQGMVTAGELEAKVRLVMEGEEGERLRARVAEHKEAAATAWKKDGGSSRAAFGQFLSDARQPHAAAGLTRPR